MTPADSGELGFDVTVGIAAITNPNRYIVAVSDQRISYDDWFPATEQGARKIIKISERFFLMYSATDLSLYVRVAQQIIHALGAYRENPDSLSAESVVKIAAEGYAHVHAAEFTARHLVQLGYKSIEDFRKNGRTDLGPEIFADYLTLLAKFDLGVELVIFGFAWELPRLFAVTNPGRTTELNWQGYAALGSGATIAYASLRHKPLPGDLQGLIYRLLEAKFASETARDVGKTTTLMTMKADGSYAEMTNDEIEAIRAIWKRTQDAPTPADASPIIAGSKAVRDILAEDA